LIDIITLGHLLDIDEVNYTKSRRNYALKNTVWFSRKTIAITIATFLVSLLFVSLYISFSEGSIRTSDLSFSSFLIGSQATIPIALGLSLIPIIVSIAINNLNLQKANADISASFSEMMIIRGKITLLQEKLVSMRLGKGSTSTI